MNIFRVLLLLSILSLYSYGCALCKLQVPDVNVTVQERHADQHIILDINWSFQKYFSAETLLGYDTDRDGKLGQNELAEVTKSFTDYLSQNDYLTFIKYVPVVEAYDKAAYLDFKISQERTVFVDDTLRFSYKLVIPHAPQKGYELYITFFDKQKFFNFKVGAVQLQEDIGQKEIVISGGSTSFIPCRDVGEKPTMITSDKIKILQGHEVVIEEKSTDLFTLLKRQMEKTKESIFTLVEEIETEGSLLSYFWLLVFSLIYGIIHALGPGHGKSLVAAYFLGNNRSMGKAFGIASLIGVVHTFSAFLLTFAVYYVLNAYLSEYFTDLESVTIKISAVVIILIALYLLYKKIPKKKTQPVWSTANPDQHASSCGCGACKSTSTDLGIILAAGIVPCPGTITIFVFSLSLGAYTVGFLSAVFMSIGMSIIIFAAALLSIRVRKQTASSQTLRAVLDYGSLLFIFLLGVMLFFFA